MRARALHSGDARYGTEGSPLEYGLDYSLRQVRGLLKEGVRRGDGAVEALKKLTQHLDELREFHELFKGQLGYLACVRVAMPVAVAVAVPLCVLVRCARACCACACGCAPWL